MARLRVLRIAERERVEAGDRPRPHGEHVAQDAADAGCRALIGLDVARVVVALHLEHDREPVADRDHAGVLARPLDHVRRAGRQRAQMDLRGLVRAVLVPHRRENAELGDRRLAADQLQNALVFLGLEAVLGDQRGSDCRFVGDHASGDASSPLFRGDGRAAKRFYPPCPQLIRDIRVAGAKLKRRHDLSRRSRSRQRKFNGRHAACAKCATSPGEQPAPVGAADRGFDVVFRMRHQAEHVAAFRSARRRSRWSRR